MIRLYIFLCCLLCVACSKSDSNSTVANKIRLEKINYFKYPKDSEQAPFKSRLTYYFNDGKPYKWLELDSLNRIQTEYIYEYDASGLQIGAKYREDGERDYSIEKVRFINDTTQVTEWLDSLGQVYYTMTDNLNTYGKTIRAEFKGKEVHGYDSTFYNSQGFPERIFFTSSKGKIFNDRCFKYDVPNQNGDWIIRQKIMADSIKEIQEREVYYSDRFTTIDSIFYPGILSNAEYAQNVFSFSKDQKTLFLTETENWDLQNGKLFEFQDGLLLGVENFKTLDSIYNGSISPSGNQIIFTKRKNGVESNWLLKKQGNKWSEPINVSDRSKLVGGYFHWYSETELFFYISEGNGNLVQGQLIADTLKITRKLTEINTEKGTEFSPYVAWDKAFIIFTRYNESTPNQQGFFISNNKGTKNDPKWDQPVKIKGLPYGWNACLRKKGSQFLFTDGTNIKSIPFETLDIQL